VTRVIEIALRRKELLSKSLSLSTTYPCLIKQVSQIKKLAHLNRLNFLHPPMLVGESAVLDANIAAGTSTNP
jgi:hypothetical protein